LEQAETIGELRAENAALKAAQTPVAAQQTALMTETITEPSEPWWRAWWPW
jgi:hypothetical protein